MTKKIQLMNANTILLMITSIYITGCVYIVNDIIKTMNLYVIDNIKPHNLISTFLHEPISDPASVHYTNIIKEEIQKNKFTPSSSFDIIVTRIYLQKYYEEIWKNFAKNIKLSEFKPIPEIVEEGKKYELPDDITHRN